MRIEHAENGRQGLLPDAMEDGLRRLIRRGFGVSILLVTALAWLALINWSPDPTRSSLLGIGSPGILHIVADVLLQTLGIGAAVCLFAPTFWGVETFINERLARSGRRLLAWPFAFTAFAGAFGALPKPAAWPLPDGLGGVVGAFLFQLVRAPLFVLDTNLATILAFVLLLALGVLALVVACGMASGMPLVARLLASGTGDDAGYDDHEDDRRRRRTDLRFDGNPIDGPTIGGDHVGGTASAAARRPPARNASPNTNGRPEFAEGDEFDQADADPVGFESLDDDPDSRKIAERFAHRATARQRTGEEVREVAPTSERPTGNSDRKSEPRTAAPRRPTGPQFRLPSVKLLNKPAAARPGPEFTQSVLRGNARLLEDVLADFGIKGKIVHVSPGPVITLYELEPARGVRAARVIALADDIARAMSAVSARIGVIPGKNAIGIELPNIRRETVNLRELLETEAFIHGSGQLPLALGKGIAGEPVIADLARMPHLLIAGTTGSGKSVGLNAMILSLIYRRTPAECRLILIDPKMLEMSVYNDIPHLLTPVITDPRKAVAALEWAVGEMEERYKRMSLLNVRSIETFNNCIANASRQGSPLTRSVQTGFDRKSGQPIVETEQLDLTPLPYIVIVIDEMADLMMSAKQEIETAIQRLSQKARAAGIHLITATQRPSVDIVTGTIKANLPARISYKVASKIDSRTILGEQGAEQLLGAGDLLFDPGASQTVRLHGPFVSEDEVRDVVGELLRQGPPSYVDAVTAAVDDPREVNRRPGKDADDLYDRAVALTLRDRRASVDHLRKRLHIGAARAGELIERMQNEGVISEANASGRHSLMTAAE